MANPLVQNDESSPLVADRDSNAVYHYEFTSHKGLYCAGFSTSLLQY